ncbi:Protein PAT1 1 [Orchesella cincta]|uniref:Protein PAT1 1 n=1 Tax=Orchesella cincta TaxID=48709 RepID=A0A1D2MRL1_ORCCI|nr:Protein PAT1 1 [Orchesella cincta]
MEEEEQPEWAVVPEDEYDALNDETFGGTGAEYTWEDPSSLFENVPKGLSDLNGASNGYPKSGVQTMGPTAPTDTGPKETEYYDYDNDNALEESISRLVLDDLEDTEDEEEARKLKLSRLGATSNFNTYFMPPQVASKHLHWLIDKELPGGSSLLGSSVWSMHPTAPDDTSSVHHTPPATVTKPVPPPVANIAIKQHSVRANHVVANNDSSGAGSVGGDSGISKFFGNVPSSTPKNLKAKKPVFKTVEEIEKELLEDGNKADLSSTIDEPSPIINAKPKVLMAEDLERELIQESPMQTPKSLEDNPSGRNPLQALGQFNQVFNTDSPTGQQSQAQITQNQQPTYHGIPTSNAANFGPSANVNFNSMQGGPQGVMNSTAANAAINNFLLMEQQKQLLLVRQGLLPTPPHHGMHPNMLPSGPIPPQLAQSFHHHQQQQQQHLRMLQHMNPHAMRHRMPMMMPLPPVIPQIRPHVHPHAHGFGPAPPMSSGYRKQMMKTDDPYRGLMTEKDKQRLRNIQIIQLQNDHPFTTDYYSLMYKVKLTPGGGDDVQKHQLLSKLYPKRDAENVQRSHYEPARFENSLGKLQAVSALAPKRVIDTFIRVTECRNTSRGGMKAYRYLLLEIEKLYECLLTMEEADIRVAILCNADERDCHRRSQNTEKITKILTNYEKLLSVLSVTKGKMLICRVLPLTDAALRYKVIGNLLDIFPLWGSDDMDKAFPYLRHCILHAEIRDLLTLIGAVTDNNVFESIVMTKLGVSLLTCVYHQAEILLSRCEPMLMEDLESLWTRKSVFGILAVLVKNDEMAEPIEIYPNMLDHIRRFALHSTDYQVLENILQRWASKGIPTRQ